MSVDINIVLPLTWYTVALIIYTLLLVLFCHHYTAWFNLLLYYCTSHHISCICVECIYKLVNLEMMLMNGSSDWKYPRCARANNINVYLLHITCMSPKFVLWNFKYTGIVQYYHMHFLSCHVVCNCEWHRLYLFLPIN